MKSRSTQVVVGLCGNDSTITRGLGWEYSHCSTMLAKNSSPVPSGISRTLAPANSGPKMWIG